MLPTTESAIGETPALIVVDAQDSESETDHPMRSDCGSIPGGREAIVDRINTVVEHARDADVPIVWGKELHRTDFADYGSELESCEPEHGAYGSAAERLDADLVVDEADLPPAEYVVEKRRYNFFHRTDIEHILSTYDVDTVILVGFMTNICVHYTAHGAHERDYAFRVVEEGTGAPTDRLHEIGLECIRYLQPRGLRNVEAVTEALDDYAGNPVVQRVKEEGKVTQETGAVPPTLAGKRPAETE
ncbi:cysteine hydrolase family protein [Halomicroarcula sp. GCM10025709]|uniref:cysteine hydrolase family protein n=1 Tax=Haloarcula TaxID=2237 RepID=UPI0024C424B0|nr:isochorismatase family cysteine hydrolase [Halomicroarcula sp. YJ-61-S]